MQNGFEAPLKEPPIESKPEMPPLAAEEFVSPLMEVDDVAVNEANHLVEASVFLKCRLEPVHSWKYSRDIIESLKDTVHDSRIIPRQLKSDVRLDPQIRWRNSRVS